MGKNGEPSQTRYECKRVASLPILRLPFQILLMQPRLRAQHLRNVLRLVLAQFLTLAVRQRHAFVIPTAVRPLGNVWWPEELCWRYATLLELLRTLGPLRLNLRRLFCGLRLRGRALLVARLDELRGRDKLYECFSICDDKTMGSARAATKNALDE